ncbi:MAG TPA: hypothetical protein VJ892_03645 [Candidatus Absconditabacterales bacterium]|nr:hypothetical protein [Candidatus Absconditabacterales bacterium]
MQSEKNINNKIELSLSSIMFFSPLIQNLIKKKDKISTKEKSFINGFIKIGYFNITLLMITIVLQAIYYMTNNSIYQITSIIIASVLALSLVISSIYAISDIEIIKNKTQEKTENNNKLEKLLNYIPLYNIYIWYKKHDFENPNIILKESIIIRGLYSLLFITFTNSKLNRLIFVILIVRIIMLINDINYGNKVKTIVNNLFKKNPEEIRGYFSGTIFGLINKKSIKENINIQKKEFEFLFKFEEKQILLEYIILFGLSIYGLYKGFVLENIIFIFSILFILSRYIIMIIKRNHVPHIPIIKGITQVLFKNK